MSCLTLLLSFIIFSISLQIAQFRKIKKPNENFVQNENQRKKLGTNSKHRPGEVEWVYASGADDTTPTLNNLCNSKYNVRIPFSNKCIYTNFYPENCEVAVCNEVQFLIKQIKNDWSLSLFQFLTNVVKHKVSPKGGTPCKPERVCKIVSVTNESKCEKQTSNDMSHESVQYANDWISGCPNQPDCVRPDNYKNTAENEMIKQLLNYAKCDVQERICTPYNPVQPNLVWMHCYRKNVYGKYCEGVPLVAVPCKKCSSYKKDSVTLLKAQMCPRTYPDSNSKIFVRNTVQHVAVDVEGTGGCAFYCENKNTTAHVLPDGSECLFDVVLPGYCIMGTCFPSKTAEEIAELEQGQDYCDATLP